MLALAPLLLLAARPAVASFNLDTVVTDYWYYVHNHLADTTSQECLAAYRAEIQCDKTLLGMVASGSPNFNPGEPELQSMCSATCKSSLDSFVDNVRKACSAPGDGALLSTSKKPKPKVPVHVVGEVFQYKYAWGCARNSTSWCYLDWFTDPSYARSEFPCTSGCSIKAMQIAHDYPGSNYIFGYSLSEQSSWWKDVYKYGWQTVQRCLKNGDVNTDTTSSRSKTSSTKATRTTTTSSSSAQTTTSSDESTATQSSESMTTESDGIMSILPVTSAPTSTPSSDTSASGKLQPAGLQVLLGLFLSFPAIVFMSII